MVHMIFGTKECKFYLWYNRGYIWYSVEQGVHLWYICIYIYLILSVCGFKETYINHQLAEKVFMPNVGIDFTTFGLRQHRQLPARVLHTPYSPKAAHSLSWSRRHCQWVNGNPTTNLIFGTTERTLDNWYSKWYFWYMVQPVVTWYNREYIWYLVHKIVHILGHGQVILLAIPCGS